MRPTFTICLVVAEGSLAAVIIIVIGIPPPVKWLAQSKTASNRGIVIQSQVCLINTSNAIYI